MYVDTFQSIQYILEDDIFHHLHIHAGYSQAGNTLTSNIKPISTKASKKTVKPRIHSVIKHLHVRTLYYAIFCDSLSTAIRIPEAS